MKTVRLLQFTLLGTLAIVIVCSTAAWGGPAEDADAQAQTLLKKADFDGAMRAFAAAAKDDPQNQQYRRSFAMVRQVIAMRDRLEKEQDPKRWEYIARALMNYYTNERIYPAALELGEKMHTKLQTTFSARMLAETQLAMDRASEAEKMLAALDPQKANVATKSLYGLALIQNGKTAEAKKVADSLVVPDNTGPRALYCAARLQAAVGNSQQAVELLRRAMENIPPSLQDGYRSHARGCDDFAGVSQSDAFAKALAVESKIAESKCSGGGKCAGCPNRGKCAKAAGQ